MREPRLVTLEGDYPSARVTPLNLKYQRQPDLLGSWGETFLKTIASPITSTAKALGHTVGEASRGISRGDIGRVFMSPVKGVSHGVADLSRTTSRHLEYYYSPSKMGWMKPIGAMVATAGVIPTPASPFLLASGAALSAGGAIGDKIHQDTKVKKAAERQSVVNVKKQINASENNLYLYGALGVGALAVIFMVT